MDYDLLCLLRCCRRPQGLARSIRLALREIPDAGVSTFVVCAPDPRASEGVRRVVESFEHEPNFLIYRPQLPILSPQHGQRWIETLNEMAAAFDATGNTACWMIDLDDDVFFSDGWQEQLPALLSDDGIDCYKAISLFLWDEGRRTVNVRQHHWSPWLGRYLAGMPRDLKFTDRIQDWVRDSILRNGGRMETLPFYLLDDGSASEADRQACFRACSRAGKLDDYTKKYIEAPELVYLEEILVRFQSPADFENWQRKYLFGL